MELAGKRLLIGVTGGIAAYKTCELVRRLQDEGAQLQVVMTRAATEFVTPTTFQALSGRPVFVDQWGAEGGRVANAMPHIDLSRDVDAIVVAPASADFIARIAHGLADELLAAVCVARRVTPPCPLLLAPAMNVEMWSNPATRRNVRQVLADGVELLGPAAGDQACGEVGLGRMLEPAQLLEAIVARFQPKRLAGRHVLITAGPTFEPIDPVRGITNLSSGKMGFALARAAREAGATVTLVAGPTALATPLGVRRVDVRTAREMHDAVMAEAGAAQVFIGVAAVADWRVANASAAKLKKTGDGQPPRLEFVLNPDILAGVAALPKAPFCVGFAAESENVVDNARAKLKAKKLAMVIGNRAQDALGADQSELVIVDARGETTLPRAAKLAQARRVVDAIAERLG
jgi:phosphopantothenoylcysteine decarboxylase/phosphopantothenate--cysteine ligase